MDDARADFLRRVETLVLELRGRGLMLSPKDVAIVEAWRGQGLPAHVVEEALREGHREFRERNPPWRDLPTTLKYFESHVERAMQLRRLRLLDGGMYAGALKPGGDGAQGEGAGGAEAEREGAARDALLGALAEAGRALDGEEGKGVLREAYKRLRAPDVDLWTLTPEVDGHIVSGLERLLDEDEAERSRAEVAAAVQARGGAVMSAKARAEATARARARWVRERFGVPELMEILLAADV